MKTYNRFILECEYITCEDEELQEGLRRRLAGVGVAAALAASGGSAAKAATHTSGHVNVSHGAQAGKVTDSSVKNAVSKAIDKPGTEHSASSETGKMKTTVSGGINVSGKLGSGGGSDKQKEKREKRAEKNQNNNDRAERRVARQERRANQSSSSNERGSSFKPKNIRHKLTTKTRYAVPTGTKGHQSQEKRMGTSGNRTASGPNQVGRYQRTGDTSSGGGKYTRTRVVGDPSGPGSTGNTVNAGKFKRLFGKGGKFRNVDKVPDNVGKPYKM